MWKFLYRVCQNNIILHILLYSFTQILKIKLYIMGTYIKSWIMFIVIKAIVIRLLRLGVKLLWIAYYILFIGPVFTKDIKGSSMLIIIIIF